MVTNRVEADLLVGRDTLTPAIARIRGMSGGLKSSLGDFDFPAAQLAINGVTSSIRGMTNALSDASKFQTSGIASASDISTGLKISLESSLSLVKDTQMKISEIASEVGGEVQDFNAIFRQVASAIAPLSKDPLDFQSKALEISKRAGVLSSLSGANAEQTGSVLDRFVSGTSTFSELALNDIFQKNAVLTSEIRRLMKEKGFDAKDLKKMTAEMRLDVLTKGFRVAVPDSLLNEFKSTARVAMTRLKSKLFDPQTGFFGWEREIPKMNNRTVLDSFVGALQSLMSLGETIGSILNRMGLSLDPMEGLLRFFDLIRDISNSANLLLTGDIDFNLADISDNIGNFFGGLIDKAYAFVDKIPADKIGLAIGGLVFAFAEALVGLIPKIAVYGLKLFEKWITGLVFAVFVAPVKLLADQVVKGLKSIIDFFVKPIKDFFGGVKRLFDQLVGLLPKLPSFSLPSNPVEAIKSFGNGIIDTGKSILGIPKDPSQTQPLPQASPQSSPQGNTGTPPFVANLSVTGSAQDANAIAQAVMGQLNQAYGQFKQGSLA